MRDAPDSLAAQKAVEAEDRVAILRLLVVAEGALTYLFLMDRAALPGRLADTLAGLSCGFALWMLLARPYRRWPLLVSGYFTVTIDTLFIALWIYATGGPSSPFVLLAYLSVFAVAFRNSGREALIVAAFYDVAYVALLWSRHQLADDPAVTLTRLVYVVFAAMIGSLLVGQVSEHAVATTSALAREKQSRANAVAAERRSGFIAEASKALASSLDYEQTLATIARLVVPEFGDFCVVDVLDSDGALQRVAETARDPADLATLRKLRAFPVTSESSVATALRKFQTIVIADMDKAGLEELAGGRGDEYVRIVRQLRLRTMASVPLSVHGRALGTMSIGTAVEPRRYPSEDLRLIEELALRAALAIEHARLYRDAREAIRTRDDFMSIASHELRTPLNVMLLQTDGLLRQAKKEDDSKLYAPLERIKRQVNRLGALVESLLDVSRITAGRLMLELGEVELGSVVTEVVARLRDEAARTGATITVIAPREIVGRWDRLRIDQVATNLLSNAIKYGAGKPIEVELGVAGDRARLRVSDHGIGIDKENQARIFERFERAVSSKHYGGFGLGLWIVRQVIQAHGGEISIESRIGEGSTFIAELPLDGPAPSSRPSTRDRAQGGASGRGSTEERL